VPKTLSKSCDQAIFVDQATEAARPCRRAPRRAVDQHGQVIDVLLSVRRDLAAARRFFTL